MPNAIYRFFGSNDVLLYVGRSKNPFKRLNGHLRDKDMKAVKSITIQWVSRKVDIVAVEAAAIRSEKPVWNIHHTKVAEDKAAKVAKAAELKAAKKAPPRTVNIPVRVSNEEREAYTQAANALGVSKAEVARAAWDRMVRRAEKGKDK